jgi:hypothetical protein
MLPRLLRLHPSTCQRLLRLSKEAERDGAYRVAKRLRAVALNSKGHSSGELAGILDAPRSKVSAWLLNTAVRLTAGGLSCKGSNIAGSSGLRSTPFGRGGEL